MPNFHGGFEQYAEYLSKALVQRGHEVSVYNSHTHPYKERFWYGVEILRQYDPEDVIGTPGQFIYDLNCILDARKRNFDIIYQLGYNSNAIWHKLLPRESVIVTNMDGLEWKRAKYSKPVQHFLRFSEKLAAKSSDYLIADSKGIQDYLKSKYNRESTFIPYGANLHQTPDLEKVSNFELMPYDYDMLIARFEPENNIEMILKGFSDTTVDRSFVVIGNYFTPYGQYIRESFTDDRIKFLGKIYDIEILNNLRHFSNLYFHGHSVGGTNPSLLEAMASNGLICAHENVFNKSVLGSDGYYFDDATTVSDLVMHVNKSEDCVMLQNNRLKIQTLYNWPKVVDMCEKFMMKVIQPQYAIAEEEFVLALT